MTGAATSRLAMALTALALTVSGCWAGSGSEQTSNESGAAQPAPPKFSSYVALGDSYTAAPLVPVTDVANGCFRSNGNYPSLLARRLRVRQFTDVSCSGATTDDLTRRQHTFRQATVPPQLRALRRDTDLVTVGIGGNDFGLFGRLAYACTRTGSGVPQGAPCSSSLGGATDLGRTTRKISDAVTASLLEIKRRAPRATVVLVGYLRLVPDRGRCARLPFATGDYAFGRRVSRALDSALAQAARRAHVRYADAYAMSAGHDVCSARPWVNGDRTYRHRAMAYHPLAAGERAVAERLAGMLS